MFLRMHNRIGAPFVLLVAVALWSRSAAADGGALQLSRGEIRIVCPLTVGGSFDAKSSAVAGTLTPVSSAPAAYAGDVILDLRMLDTGIGFRNTHLQERYLETGKGDGFDRAVVSDVRLPDVKTETFEGRTKFTGTLLLHGVRRPIDGQVQVRRSAASTHADASFSIKLSDYAIAKPQYLGVGVKDDINVRVNFDLTPVASPSTR
jgi:polyisoprenoid-binding protein YceI